MAGIKKHLIFLIGIAISSFSDSNEFIKPKQEPKKSVNQLKEDCCLEAGDQLIIFARIIKLLGAIQECQMISVSEVIENDKKGTWMHLDKNKLHELHQREIIMTQKATIFEQELRSYHEYLKNL